MIDIIIPAYNAHRTIEKTINSIKNQTMADIINVYIVNDCSDTDYSEIIKNNTKISIKEIKLSKNSGPGVARQIGIDNSNSRYIMFIDADDVLFDSTSVESLYNEIINNNYDEVTSIFLLKEENGNFIEKYNELIWLHGKIYKRDFLVKNNIKFNDTFYYEDIGFNKLIYLMDANIGFLNKITYIYIKNPNSVTNSKKYRFDGVEWYIYNLTWAIEIALNKTKNKEKLQELLFSTLTSIYFYYLQFMNENGSDVILKKSKKLKEIYLKNNDFLDSKKESEIFLSNYDYFNDKMKNIDKLSKKISFASFMNKL